MKIGRICFCKIQCQANYPCLSGCGNKEKNKSSDLKHHDVDHDDDEERRINQELNTTSKISVIILDCTNIQFIDEAGFKALKESINGYLNDGFKFFLTNCHGKYNSEILIFLLSFFK